MKRPEYVAIGYVKRAHGVRGAIIVDDSLTDNPDRFPNLTEVYIDLNGDMRQFIIESCSRASRGWIVKLGEVDDRDDAEELRGHYFEVKADQLPNLEEDVHYVFELIGLDVFDEEGNAIGTLREVLQYPANDVYVVESDKGRMMIPATDEIVKKIDLSSRRMEVKLLSGLSFE